MQLKSYIDILDDISTNEQRSYYDNEHNDVFDGLFSDAENGAKKFAEQYLDAISEHINSGKSIQDIQALILEFKQQLQINKD